MAGFGGETSEALVVLARLGCTLLLAYWGLLGAVLGVVAMLEACTGYLSDDLLEPLLFPPVSLLATLHNTSSFDVRLPR